MASTKLDFPITLEPGHVYEAKIKLSFVERLAGAEADREGIIEKLNENGFSAVNPWKDSSGDWYATAKWDGPAKTVDELDPHIDHNFVWEVTL